MAVTICTEVLFMKIEYNIPSVLSYYGASSTSAQCASFLFDANEPVSAAVFPPKLPVYCLFSMKVSALQQRLPFPEVMKRAYTWPDTVCVSEAFSQSTSQRIGLFLIERENINTALQMYPNHALSLAFFVCSADAKMAADAFDKAPNSLLLNPPGLFKAAVTLNAALIHCINGWDGYSINRVEIKCQN